MRKTILLIALCGGVGVVLAGEPPNFDEETYQAQMPVFGGSLKDLNIDESKLNAVEKRLNAIVIPEIDLRQANIVDIIKFFDSAIPQFGTGQETNDATRIRLYVDVPTVRDDPPVITFACRKMPLLYALNLTVQLGRVSYRVEGNVVTVFRPKQEAKVPDNTGTNAPGSKH
jgi:hypothetical protein